MDNFFEDRIKEQFLRSGFAEFQFETCAQLINQTTAHATDSLQPFKTAVKTKMFRKVKNMGQFYTYYI